MRNQNLKYLRGTILKVQVENKRCNKLLIINDVLDSDSDIICIKIENETGNPNYEKIIVLPNEDYNISNHYIHMSVVDYIVQKIIEREYPDDDESINGKERLIKKLNYISM